MDTVGKHSLLSKCVIGDVLFRREASREYSVEICFPTPSACLPIRYGVLEGEA